MRVCIRVSRGMRAGLLAAAMLAVAGSATADCVLLLHGLGRQPTSLIVLEKTLEQQGFQVVNHGYASTAAPIGDMAPEVGKGLADCPADQPVHIVTHSLGGILARIWLQDHQPRNLGRVVMMGPPNQGSPLADILRDVPGYRLTHGYAGQQLGTGADSLPLSLGPVDFPLGVIAGDATLNPLSSSLIKGADDGKVAVPDTAVDGMSDHVILPVTHTFMMNNPTVIRQVLNFLREGQFQH